LVALTDYN